MMDKKNSCCVCGTDLTSSDIHKYNDELYCNSCLNSEFIICEDCGTRVHKNNALTDTHFSCCRKCYDEKYVRCYECGKIIEFIASYGIEGTGTYLCSTCYNHDTNCNIMKYNYKPTPIFHGDNCRYLGIELEVDRSTTYSNEFVNSDSGSILEIANNSISKNIYIKHDGSLKNGFEIVSHPCSLEYHMLSMPWKSIMNKLISLGYKSDSVDTCGLHCHINRSSFGHSKEEQNVKISRVMYLIEKYWDKIVKLSRRDEDSLSNWASRYGSGQTPKHFLRYVQDNNSESRYKCLNLQNNNTIEFRFFKGTLHYNIFAASLQFIDYICMIASNYDDSIIIDMKWNDFIKIIYDNSVYSDLLTYIKCIELV